MTNFFFFLPKYVQPRSYTKMSATTEAIDLVDNLVKAKIPKATAKQLVGYADKQRDKGIDRLWIAIAILTAIALGGFAWLRSDMQKLESRMDKRFDNIEAEQKEQKKLLLRILKKK